MPGHMSASLRHSWSSHVPRLARSRPAVPPPAPRSPRSLPVRLHPSGC